MRESIGNNRNQDTCRSESITIYLTAKNSSLPSSSCPIVIILLCRFPIARFHPSWNYSKHFTSIQETERGIWQARRSLFFLMVIAFKRTLW